MFRLIEAGKASFPIAFVCKRPGVSTSGYYAWQKRGPSARAVNDAELAGTVRQVHATSRGTYGAPRIHAELADASGIRCGRKRMPRLMRTARLVGVCRRRPARTTRRDEAATPSDDLVHRSFAAAEPDRPWVADITYLPTWQGFLYLAIILDAFSRRVVGWAMADHLRAELVVEAPEMATWNRRPSPGLAHHSDHGCQYTGLAFGQRCRRGGIAVSTGSVGDRYDNAVAESSFATLECELVDRSRWRTLAEARMAVFDYIEGSYNPRRHSALAYRSPAEHERRHQTRTTAA